MNIPKTVFKIINMNVGFFWYSICFGLQQSAVNPIMISTCQPRSDTFEFSRAFNGLLARQLKVMSDKTCASKVGW
jgi:fucose permease